MPRVRKENTQPHHPPLLQLRLQNPHQMTRATDTFLDRIEVEKHGDQPRITATMPSGKGSTHTRRLTRVNTILQKLCDAETRDESNSIIEAAQKNPVAAAYINALISADSEPNLRLAAAEKILDRVEGKPTQTQIHQGEGDTAITITSLAVRAAQVLNQIPIPPATPSLADPGNERRLPGSIVAHLKHGD